MSLGFDFGTTNSLMSLVAQDQLVNLFDEEGRPYPSIVRYEGESVIAGRAARDAIDAVGIGVYGNTIRSPKFLLHEESVNVGGVERNPIDVVADLIKFVKNESKVQLKTEINSAVVTIPVAMNGEWRRSLRDACKRADLDVIQYVHEPLAAIYGYFRGASDSENLTRKYANRYVLVVDWGGGTLDITLCKIEGSRILQLRNGRSDAVGGDQFDEVIRDEIVKRFKVTKNLEINDQPSDEARLKLSNQIETAKIKLSSTQQASILGIGFFEGSGTNFEYKLGRGECDEIVRPLVDSGVAQVRSLLSSLNFPTTRVSMCLLVGGMASMPLIRSEFYSLFGAERVVVPENSGTLVAEGAAWIAHDRTKLELAKPLELELARGSREVLIRAGTTMPQVGEIQHEDFSFFCVDPTDGRVQFPLVTPVDLSKYPQASDPRNILSLLTLEVDRLASKLFERLWLNVAIDDDMILHARVKSNQDSVSTEIYDLEFGISLPGDKEIISECEPVLDREWDSGGQLAIRSNVSSTEKSSLVPGEVLYRYRPEAFRRYGDANDATTEQLKEHFYYQPCQICGQKWSNCKCSSEN